MHLPKADAGIFNEMIELDSNEDDFASRKNCTLLHHTKHIHDVVPYSDENETKTDISIAQVATGKTMASGRRCMLLSNESLHVLELENYLINPNQLRHCEVKVQDNPYSLDPIIIEKSHEGE